MLSARDLRFAYPTGEFSLRVPQFDAREGETTGIAGPSGAGKTTFLRLLCGIFQPDAGTLTVCGEDSSKLAASRLRALRLRKIGLVFQDFALLDYLTVAENIVLPAQLGGSGDQTLVPRAREIARRLEMDRHWNHRAGELSQGERQRVAVARALAHQPRAVLADEPTSSLDARRSALVMELLTNYAREEKAALVVVTHDESVLGRLDRIVNVEEWAR